jgi:formylglycine-generating enzyme required for sulfatase activity
MVQALPEMMIIPASFFLMGSDEGPQNERPRHRVWLDSFAMAKFPVTNGEYKIYLADSQAVAPPFWSERMFADPEQPVVGVSWHDAVAYCAWLRARTGKTRCILGAMNHLAKEPTPVVIRSPEDRSASG